MELLPPPDFFDSLDFNFLTAEIFHTQEHEFDATLTDPEKQLQQLECNQNSDAEERNGTSNENGDDDYDEVFEKEEVPIHEEKEIMKQEIVKPKVDI